MAFGEGTGGPMNDAALRGLRVVAKSVFKELKRTGYSRGEMVTFASELLDLVTHEMKSESNDDEGAAS